MAITALPQGQELTKTSASNVRSQSQIMLPDNKSACEKIAKIFNVTTQDISDLFSKDAKVARGTLNKLFSKFYRLKEIEITKEAWDAYFGDQDGKYDSDKDCITSPEELLRRLNEMQEIAQVTDDSLVRMLISTNIVLVDKKQITEIAKEMLDKYNDKLSTMKELIRMQLMRAEGDRTKVDDDKLNYLLGVKLIYGKEDGVLGQLINRGCNIKGVNLLNARVMKEFCGNILESFIEEGFVDKEGKPLENRIEDLKNLSEKIDDTEKWLQKMEPKVEDYLHINKMTSNNNPKVSFKLTNEDYTDDKVWDIYKDQIMKRDLKPAGLWAEWQKIQGILKEKHMLVPDKK